MRFLVDTQSFIWFAEADPKLPAPVADLMERSDSRLVISIASLWEMTIKMSLGKLALSGDIAVMIDKTISNGFTILPIEPKHLITLSTLEFFHRDPFDRIIIAQSISENMPLISSDDVFNQYPVERIWNR